jgi:pyruvate-formate lyase
MSKQIDNAERWRMRAAQVRSLAEVMSTLDRKRKMMEIAASYDVLAERAKQTAREPQQTREMVKRVMR